MAVTFDDVRAQLESMYEKVTNEYQSVINVKVAALEEKVRLYSVQLEDELK